MTKAFEGCRTPSRVVVHYTESSEVATFIRHGDGSYAPDGFCTQTVHESGFKEAKSFDELITWLVWELTYSGTVKRIELDNDRDTYVE